MDDRDGSAIVMKRERATNKRGIEVENKYIKWLISQHGWNDREAYLYARWGKDELIRYQRNGWPDPQCCARCRTAWQNYRAAPHPVRK